MATLFAQIDCLTDNEHKPTYEDATELTQALQGLHMSQILGIDDDGADEAGPNDIDISRMNGTARNDDYTIGGSTHLQQELHTLIKEYDDIFSYSVKGRSMDVPPMEFNVDKKLWEASGNRLASRQISIEKQAALSTLIDELLERDVIRPSKATAWSQVHLVRKPSGGWRFTIDYRALNKVITNEGWQIPNMKDMLQRIGSLKPKVFGVADLTQGFYQMPLDERCWPSTAFISFRGIYEWKRVPMGLTTIFMENSFEYITQNYGNSICVYFTWTDYVYIFVGEFTLTFQYSNLRINLRSQIYV